MKTHPLVSIIINCYNGQEYLRETLDSIHIQSFTDWELVFWNNKSTDESEAIFRRFDDSRFNYFLADRHTKLGEARNLAVAEARGDWLAFVDCDDIWDPEKLNRQLQAAGNDPDIGLIYGPVTLLVEQTDKSTASLAATLTRNCARPHPPQGIYDALLEGNFIIFSTVLIKRSLFNKVGGIDCRLEQNEDYDLLLKTSRICKAVCVSDVCATYRIHASNNSHRQEENSYRENGLIYNALPQDARVERARSINASKRAVFELRHHQYFAAFRRLLWDGSILWTLQRILGRILMQSGTARKK